MRSNDCPYLVGVSYFTESCENLALTLRNVNKSLKRDFRNVEGSRKVIRNH